MIMTNVTFLDIADIYDDNHGIVMTDSELILKDSFFLGGAKSDYQTKVY